MQQGMSRTSVLRAIGMWVMVGAAVALAGIWFQPRYQSLCLDMYEGFSPTSCDPPSRMGMAGYALMGLGIISLIFAPIVLSIWSEIRTEGDTRLGRRSVNLGLLAGVLYLAAGVGMYAALG